MFLQLRGLTKTFAMQGATRVSALEDLHLAIERSEFVSIVGASGCGKTTILNVIAGLPPYFPPDRGEVWLEGSAITGPGAERGMVFQEYALFPWRTVEQNIEYGLRLKGVPPGERREICRYYIGLMGLTGFEHVHPHQLSGGMKQRAAIARALAVRPKVLLMDEPFAAVDAQTRMTLQEHLGQVWEEERNTVIFVTHHVAEAIFLSDRVIAMTRRPGRIRADVPVRLKRPRVWSEINTNSEFLELQETILRLIGETR
ncbi:MAG: ABC transporter ATP-binding protein [Deltaproteobacteria bacterium]|nr:ABC transporter ATP-binding protein [Deltaproteobacteria bacterium]MBI3078140.1 ABC transporter ATP-binding protein [Deltaproteobacteria bacterium]